MRPIPVTAYSAVNALGRNTRDVLAALDAGKSGLGPSPLPVTMETVVGAIPGRLEPLPAAYSAYDTRLARIGLLGFEDVREPVRAAVNKWGAHRVAILIGTMDRHSKSPFRPRAAAA